MSTPDETNPSQHAGPPEPSHIEPEPEKSPASIAAELVVHGVLEFLHLRSPATREHRVVRVLKALPAPAARNFRFPRPPRWLVAAAALIVIAAGLYYVGLPGETTAQAQIDRSVAALRSPGDRRFEVRLLSWADDQPRTEPNAVVDMRAPGLMVLRHRPPGSPGDVWVGRDAQGDWAISNSGEVLRTRTDRYWPPWSAVEGERVFSDSIDRVIEQLPQRFKLERAPGVRLENDPRLLDRISATRDSRDGHIPHSVDLWIDPTTHLVERMEFHWATEQRTGGGPGGKGPGGPGGPPPRGGGPGGPPPDGFSSDRTDRPPPPPDGRGPRGGPDGPGGPGGPRGFGAGPGGGPGHPKMIIFQRVETPQLPADWFTPEGHRAPP